MIRLDKITKKYGDLLVLDNIDLQINDGEFVYIIGSSGTGKSTLLNLIGLMDDDYLGDYYVDDILVNKQNSFNLRKTQFAFIFQMYYLIENLTVYENLKIPFLYNNVFDYSPIDAYLEKMGLTYLKNKKVSNLSGGEKQRVAMIRALINEPKYIICDEPTGNLDEENTKLVIDILKEENSSGKAVLIVTHNKNIIEGNNIVYEIKDKKLVRIQ